MPDSVIQSRAIHLSYYSGALVNPGLRVGIEFPMTYKRKEYTKRGKTKTKEKQVLLSTHFSTFYQYMTSTSLMLSEELILRKTKTRGFKRETIFGIGYMRTFNAGKTYEVNDNGTVELIRGAGQNHLAIIVGTSIGRDLWKKKKKPIAWHFKPTLVAVAPYNTFANFLLNIEFGLVYKLR